MPMDWSALSWHAWTTLFVVAAVVGLLAFAPIGPDLIVIAGLTLLLVTGVLSPEQAFAGFANEGMLTVAVLFVVAAAIDETGAAQMITRRLLGRPRNMLSAQALIMAPGALFSAFLNNTTVVAMLMPAVADWARRTRLSVSKLMIPLSYAAVLGGVCTMIGTSTNLVVNGLLMRAGHPGLKMFDITAVGVACALAGVAFVLVFGRKLLPDRRPPVSPGDDPREYTVEMLVETGSPLVGKTIEEAGLRHLDGLYLMEVDRQGQVMAAVSPQERLEAGDRLVFVGIVESVVDLRKTQGLTPAPDQLFKIDAPRSKRCLVEAVVSDTCPLVHKTIREGRFRSQYNAVVIAVARSGERLRKKIGDIVLEPGDTLLLETLPSFVDQQRNSRDFFLVSSIENSTPPRHDRAWVALGITAALMVVAATDWMSMLKAALIAAGLMLLTRCVSGPAARRSLNLQVLLVIGCSFGIGKALEVTGLAKSFAVGLIGLAGADPWITLVIVYGVTLVLTELLTNNAAAALVFPIVVATAQRLGVNIVPFAVAVMVAASCGFATPFGYQTHMMVYGPGGYRFGDYLRIGVPLDILIWIVAVLVIPLFFKF
jgi:di/tricarboxylate transporter